MAAHPVTSSARRGTVLISTLGVIFIVAALCLVFARSMRVEAMTSANQVAAAQAAAIERGAEQYVLSLIDQEKEEVLFLTEDQFAGVPVGDGYFWIIRPGFGDENLPRYGLVDESSKVNLNTAPLSMLEALPGINEDLPPAIIDWRDDNSDISSGGAENEYYLSLPNPYLCKNAPLETIEELLLVRGCIPQILYGQDATGLPNPGPIWDGSDDRRLPIGIDLAIAQGLYDYVTIYSAEPNVTADGEQRINVNDNNARQRVTSILSEAIGQARANEVASRANPQPAFRSIFDFQSRTGLTSKEFETIADRITTSSDQVRRGLINVNTAPREVLLCLPDLDENDVASIISARAGANLDHTNIAWVADALGPKAAAAGEWLTNHSYQYTADIVAVSGNGRAFRRCRVVVDARTTPARIVFRRDLTEHGWPLGQELLVSLRNGTFSPSTGMMTSMNTRSSRGGGAF